MFSRLAFVAKPRQRKPSYCHLLLSSYIQLLESVFLCLSGLICAIFFRGIQSGSISHLKNILQLLDVLMIVSDSSVSYLSNKTKNETLQPVFKRKYLQLLANQNTAIFKKHEMYFQARHTISSPLYFSSELFHNTVHSIIYDHCSIYDQSYILSLLSVILLLLQKLFLYMFKLCFFEPF